MLIRISLVVIVWGRVRHQDYLVYLHTRGVRWHWWLMQPVVQREERMGARFIRAGNRERRLRWAGPIWGTRADREAPGWGDDGIRLSDARVTRLRPMSHC